MTKFELIQTQEQLAMAAALWNQEPELAMDLECENNLHHYGTYVALVQISNQTQNWIVDMLPLKNLQPLISIFENPKITKIFHDISFDFRILDHQYQCHPKNIFDTQFFSSIALMYLLGSFKSSRIFRSSFGDCSWSWAEPGFFQKASERSEFLI